MAFRRPPTARDIDGLIRDHVKEEVYYREARQLGLDEGDEVIRPAAAPEDGMFRPL